MKITIEITPEELTQLGIAGDDIKIIIKEDVEKIPPVFRIWVDEYFHAWNFPIEVSKNEILHDCQRFSNKTEFITTGTFKRYLIEWCNKNEYKYEDRIMKNVNDGSGVVKTTEFIKITKK